MARKRPLKLNVEKVAERKERVAKRVVDYLLAKQSGVDRLAKPKPGAIQTEEELAAERERFKDYEF